MEETDGNVKGSVIFNRNSKNFLGWDFIGRNSVGDVAFLGNDLQIVSHKNKTIYNYPEEYVERIVKSNLVLHFSPITQLKFTDWDFHKDTLMDDQIYKVFRRNEIDTFVVAENARKIVDNYIFINTKTGMLERFERRHIKNGKNLPKIISKIMNYELSFSDIPLTFVSPEKYTNLVFGRNRTALTKGEMAPVFKTKDFNGNYFSLKELIGKKDLFNFSIINCGYCKMALRHFNRKEYSLSEEINAYYINPVDEKMEIKSYADQISIPFPILVAPHKIAKRYKIRGYPTFVLIDEKGRIEKIVYGYSSQFLTSLEAPQD